MTLPENTPLWFVLTIMVLAWLWKNVGKDVYSYFWERFKKKEDSVLTAVKRETEIETGVLALMNSISADRAIVWGFHNGDHWLGNNDSKKKMSIKSEVVKDPATAKISSYYQEAIRNIPIGQVAWWVNETVEGRMRYPDTKKVPHLITRDWYDRNGVKSVLVVPIYNTEGKLTVIISYEWVHEAADTSKWQAPNGVNLDDSDGLYNYFKEQNQSLKVYL